MKLRNNQSGFSAFELILLVVVLGALAAAGFRVMESRSTDVQDSMNTASQAPKSVSDVSQAPVVNKASDLSKAADALDANDPTASNQADSNSLNGQLSNLN